jgi:type VI secretion system FHA domain protein
MTLTLSVLRCPDAVPPETKRINGGEFRIGRGLDNDWVMPDPDKMLSKKHCVVAFRNGGWAIADTSTNGTFINREPDALGPGQIRDLSDGDRIRFGAYEIEVRIDDGFNTAASRGGAYGAPARSPFDDPFSDDVFAAKPVPQETFTSSAFGNDPLFGGPPPSQSVTMPTRYDPLAPPTDDDFFAAPTLPDHSPSYSDAFRPPPVAPKLIPDDDWDLGLPTAKPAAPPAAPAYTPPPPAFAPAPAPVPQSYAPPAPPAPAAPPAQQWQAPPAAPAYAPPTIPPAYAPAAPPAYAAPPSAYAAPPPPAYAPPAPPAYTPPPAPPPAPPAQQWQPPAPAAPAPAAPPAYPASPFLEDNDVAQTIPQRQPAPPSAPAPEYTPPPAPVAPAVPPLTMATTGDLMAAFLSGAGMTNARPENPESTMFSIGAAFRAMVAGIRQALIARSSIKGEFRIEQTMIRARGNNPLKFSADDEDALSALLGVGRRTDVKAEAAVADALRDMRLHELATVAAMQGAVRAMLAQLDPARLRADADAAGGMNLLPAQKKARAFEAYEKLHDNVTRALTDDFDSVFGKAFARAYELALRDISAKEH